MIFKATVKGEGHKELQLENRDLYKTFINRFPTGTAVYISVSDKRPTRSSQQNRLYWQYLAYIEQETGNEAEALHQYFKQKFLSKGRQELNFPNRNTFSIPRYFSTTDLNTKEFTDYLRKIEVETGIILPDSEGVVS